MRDFSSGSHLGVRLPRQNGDMLRIRLGTWTLAGALLAVAASACTNEDHAAPIEPIRLEDTASPVASAADTRGDDAEALLPELPRAGGLPTSTTGYANGPSADEVPDNEAPRRSGRHGSPPPSDPLPGAVPEIDDDADDRRNNVGESRQAQDDESDERSPSTRQSVVNRLRADDDHNNDSAAGNDDSAEGDDDSDNDNDRDTDDGDDSRDSGGDGDRDRDDDHEDDDEDSSGDD